MEDTDLQALMARLELLITRVEQLKSQNGLLLAQEKTWREERAHLIEKNEIARRKVESMISRLKALEQDSGVQAIASPCRSSTKSIRSSAHRKSAVI